MANRHRKRNTKRWSISLIVREMQIKTIVKYHLPPVRMPSSKSLQITNAGEGVEKMQPSYTLGGNINWYRHYRGQYGGSLKK